MKKGIKWLLVALGALAVCAVVFVLLTPSQGVTLESLNIDSATVMRGDIQVLAHGTGALEVATVQDVFSRGMGRVVSVEKEDGDYVEEGELIALLESDTLQEQLKKTVDDLYLKELELTASRGIRATTIIRAPMAGRVKSLNARKGDDMAVVQQQYGGLAVLSTDGRMRITLPTPEGELPIVPQDVKVRVGDKVENGTLMSADSAGLTVLIMNDTYRAGDTALVTDALGKTLGEGKLVINKPVVVAGVSGKIRGVEVAENDKVQANDRLFTLEDDAVSLATEQQIFARDTMQRNLEDLRKKITYLEIRAPISGVIGNIVPKLGAMVQEGQQVATVIKTDRAKVRLAVDELDIAAVFPGQTAVVKLDALPGKTYLAEVERVLPLGNRVGDVTTYDVLLYMDAQDNMLPLMSLSGDVVVAQASGALLVPVSCLMTVGTDQYVMVMPTEADLAGANAASRAQNSIAARFMGSAGKSDTQTLQTIAPQLMRRVEVGLVSGEYAQVLSGLSDGEQIVLPRAGSQTLQAMMRMGGGNGR